jgi:hypothetical protein
LSYYWHTNNALEDGGKIVMRNTFMAVLITTLVAANPLFSAAGGAGGPVEFSCSGTKVDTARKVAKDNNLSLGMDPKACFGEMQLTESARKQIVVAVPSPTCKTGKLLNVYDRSRAGP